MRPNKFTFRFYVKPFAKFIFSKVKFSGSFEDNQIPRQINKLWGVVSHRIHNSSFRVGFSCMNGEYSLFVYRYVSGMRVSQKMPISFVNGDSVYFLLDISSGWMCVYVDRGALEKSNIYTTMKNFLMSGIKGNKGDIIIEKAYEKICPKFIDISPYIGGSEKLPSDSNLKIETFFKTFNQ